VRSDGRMPGVALGVGSKGAGGPIGGRAATADRAASPAGEEGTRGLGVMRDHGSWAPRSGRHVKCFARGLAASGRLFPLPISAPKLTGILVGGRGTHLNRLPSLV
jgi:hypothetical protein